jgi:hypothetical protein
VIEIKWRHTPSHFRIQTAFSTKLGAIFYVGVCRKMFRNFRLLQVYIRSSVKERDPRMFAEGGPERTNKRFHYVSAGLPAKRLSTTLIV